jgi:hypothetical protein
VVAVLGSTGLACQASLLPLSRFPGGLKYGKSPLTKQLARSVFLKENRGDRAIMVRCTIGFKFRVVIPDISLKHNGAP